MKIKTSELIGAQLDWAVTKCENADISIAHFIAMHSHYAYDHGTFDYSTNWAQGGPIIEQEGITLRCGLHGWDAELEEFDAISHGPTPLIAAMRVYVMAKLGDEIEVPDQLV